MLQISDRPIPTRNATLSVLIAELAEESQHVVALINQLRLPHITPQQQVDILSELLAAVVYLQTHCDGAFQDLLADEIDALVRADQS
ncbi:hypothetical protein [Trichothermofontia sp.]